MGVFENKLLSVLSRNEGSLLISVHPVDAYFELSIAMPAALYWRRAGVAVGNSKKIKLS